MLTPLPYTTQHIAGCGGLSKATPEDFVVEEIPAYLPQGEGEHLFLWIEKRGHSTLDVARALAAHCQFNEKEVSWAGQKDRQAVTRQWLCCPARFAEKHLSTFELDGVRILEAVRHQNKLKTGHLRGNRFQLVLRDVGDLPAALESFDFLAQNGLANGFGAQRFGRHRDNAEKGKAILLAGGKHRDRFERKLFLSAFQSALFNRVLAKRIRANTLFDALAGDVLKKPTGGEFICETPEIDTLRVRRFEVSPTGPIFGPDMRAPNHAVAEAEAQVLADEGIDASLFALGGGETLGTRRALRVALENPECEVAGSDLHLAFSLPSGSYATQVLAELTKSGQVELPEG